MSDETKPEPNETAKGEPAAAAEPAAPHGWHVPAVPRPKRRTWPLLGPVLTVHGALLWSYVVAGQLTTSWEHGVNLDEGWAVALVGAATLVAYPAAMRASFAAKPARPVRRVARALAVLFASLLAFVFSVASAAAAGEASRRNHEVAIAIALAFVGMGASFAGPRITGKPVSPP